MNKFRPVALKINHKWVRAAAKFVLYSKNINKLWTRACRLLLRLTIEWFAYLCFVNLNLLCMTNVVFINNGSTVCLLGLRRLMGVALGDAAQPCLSTVSYRQQATRNSFFKLHHSYVLTSNVGQVCSSLLWQQNNKISENNSCNTK